MNNGEWKASIEILKTESSNASPYRNYSFEASNVLLIRKIALLQLELLNDIRRELESIRNRD